VKRRNHTPKAGGLWEDLGENDLAGKRRCPFGGENSWRKVNLNNRKRELPTKEEKSLSRGNFCVRVGKRMPHNDADSSKRQEDYYFSVTRARRFRYFRLRLGRKEGNSSPDANKL